MAIIALHSAATGLNALETQIDVIANNLANVNTTGFKASRVNFEDLLYQNKAQPGVENANGDKRPTGIHVGLGVQVANTDRSFEQGAPVNTHRPTDVMIQGNGFFAVDIPEETSTGIGYTRAGNFIINADGELVLGTLDGPRLEPPVTIPSGAEEIDITSDGRVFVRVSGAAEASEVGQIELSSFINPTGLISIGGNIFVESDASGPPIEGTPGEAGFGTLVNGFLEDSNVDPVTELVSLIKAQRAFEMNSQVIQAADQALQVLSNLRRF